MLLLECNYWGGGGSPQRPAQFKKKKPKKPQKISCFILMQVFFIILLKGDCAVIFFCLNAKILVSLLFELWDRVHGTEMLLLCVLQFDKLKLNRSLLGFLQIIGQPQ